jgi:hypothetical protein
MEIPRSNGRFRQRATSRFVIEHSPQWVQIPDLGSVRDAAGSSQKRIFAIVSRPIPSDVKGKAIRRILLFDSHPDSLRLVLKPGANLDSDDEAKFRRERRTSIICGSILIAMLVAAMLWPLLW